MTPPSVPADDRGLLLGVGLFETLLFVDAEPRLWEAHVARLHHDCAELRLAPPNVQALRAAAAQALDEVELAHGRAAVRLTLTGGGGGRGLNAPTHIQPRLLASAARSPPPPASLALATSRIRRNPTSPTSRLKTLSYLDGVAARQEAVDAGADEALCLDVQGRVACAAAGNVFWLEGERLCTPALSCGVLAGVVRAQLLRLAPRLGLEAAQVEAEPGRLHAADVVFVTNSLIGAVPVRALDGRTLRADPARLRRLRHALDG